MNAYAASKTGTLSDTASAVGEINTRLGYTGDTLEETTEMFLDFADVTGGNAASSVRSVTQLMNQWNVDASEMESMLSKLTYAGQASGISVDTLSSQLTNNKAILDQLGFSLDEATAMFMNMELQGTQTSSVMTGFRTALSNGAISSLEELYNVLELAEEGLLSAEEASDIFGSRAGTAIVNAAQSGVFNLEDFVGALENADGTLKTTADAAQTLDEKWEQATNNISAAFTSAVQPAVDGISSALAELVNGIGTFLNEHPAVTKAITAIGVGLGVVVTGIAGVAFVTTVAIPAISAFGVALNTALGPIGWVALAITGVVAAGTALAAMMSDTEDATEGMTAVTRKQYYELESLNAEYDEACEKYGENSEEALRLKYQVDDLSEAFESNRQTVEEFTAEVDELCSSVSAVADDFSSAMKEIDSQETGTLALIQKYEDLAAQTELTGAQQQEFEAIAQELTETFPDLSDKIDSATGSTEDYIDAMRRLCEEQAEEQRQAEAQQAYVDALAKKAELEEEIAKAEENLRLSRESDANATAFWDDAWYYEKTGWLGAWATDTDEYEDALDKLNAEYAENEALIAGIEAGWAEVAEAEEEASEETMTWEEAAVSAYENVQEKVEELCEAYDEAYQSALESFQGQFGLFDEASTESEEYLNANIANAQAALDTQLTYWESYNANLEALTDYGESLTGEAKENYQALLEYASDGSEQAAGLAASMAAAIDSGDEQTITNLADTISEVQAQQEMAASVTAEWVTDFTSQMDEIEQEMKDTIDSMDLSTEATAYASLTVMSYANSIRAGKSSAVAAAQEVAAAVAAALQSGSGSSGGSVDLVETAVNGGAAAAVREATGYATGTTNSDDVFIAGEEGHELIIGRQGSRVFPTSETEKIINAVSEPQEQSVTVVNNTNNTTMESENTDGIIDKFGQYLSKFTDRLAGIFGKRQDTLDVAAHANGTLSSEDSFIAGENGPELVIGHPDSTVFPTEETDRLIEALMGMEKITSYYEGAEEITNTYEGDILNEYSSIYNSAENAIDQRAYETNQTSTDNSENRSYDYDYSQAIEKSVNDILNEYSSVYNSAENSIDQRAYETNQTSTDNSENRSYDYDYS
ncbi:MAG: phage tail tape measure protein, partial [Ruminococcus sp.]|nr:phage tail tape measure protein [Ruminococcus sp.]